MTKIENNMLKIQATVSATTTATFWHDERANTRGFASSCGVCCVAPNLTSRGITAMDVGSGATRRDAGVRILMRIAGGRGWFSTDGILSEPSGIDTPSCSSAVESVEHCLPWIPSLLSCLVFVLASAIFLCGAMFSSLDCMIITMYMECWYLSDTKKGCDKILSNL